MRRSAAIIAAALLVLPAPVVGSAAAPEPPRVAASPLTLWYDEPAMITCWQRAVDPS
jgi:hypothetical protein